MQCLPSFPSLSHFPVLFYWELSSVAQYVLFLLCRAAFYWNSSLRGCFFFLFCFFQQPHIGNYTKLKIIAWPVNACAAQTHFILGSSFSRIEQKLQTYSRWSKITLEWLAGLKSAFLGTFRTSCSIREPPFGKYSVRVHVCLEMLFIFLRGSACISCWICLYLCYF